MIFTSLEAMMMKWQDTSWRLLKKQMNLITCTAAAAAGHTQSSKSYPPAQAAALEPEIIPVFRF